MTVSAKYVQQTDVEHPNGSDMSTFLEFDHATPRLAVTERLPRLPSDAELHVQTDRLDWLPIHRSHAPEMFDLLNDVTLHQFTGGKPPRDPEALSRRFEMWEHRRSPDRSELWLNWVLRERQGGEFVGSLQAGVGVDHADIAWIVGSRWQGRGYASEAAAHLVAWLRGLGIREIRASIHPDHIASIKVAEHAGLERTDLCEDGETIWRLRVEAQP